MEEKRKEEKGVEKMFPLYGFVLGVVVFMLGARQIRLLELSSCPQKSMAQCSSWYQGFLLWGSSLFSSRFGQVTKSEHCFEILLAITTSLFFGHLWLFGLQGWYYWAAQALVCILAIRYAGDVFFANMLLACLFQLPLVPTWVGESAYKFWVGFFLVARFFYADNWGHYAKNIAHSLILLLLIRQDDLLLLVLYAVLLVFFAISALWARFTWQSIFDSLGLANIFVIAFVSIVSTLTISLPISFPAFLLPFFAIGYVLIGSWPSLPSKYFPQNEPASEPSGMWVAKQEKTKTQNRRSKVSAVFFLPKIFAFFSFCHTIKPGFLIVNTPASCSKLSNK